MPNEEWPERRLGEVISLRSGKYLAKKHFTDGGVPVMGANGSLGWYSQPNTDAGATLIGRVGACGALRPLREPAWVTDNALIATAKDGLLPGFLPNLLETVDFRRLISGGVQPLITQTAVGDALVRVPPVPVQRRVAHVLDGFEAVANTHDRHTDALHHAVRMLGLQSWGADLVKLGQLGTLITGQTPPTREAANWTPGTVPFITPGDVPVKELFVSSTARCVSDAGLKNARPLPPFSVVQVCIGASLGKVAVSPGPATSNQQINAVTGLDETDACYLAAVLASPRGEAEVRDRAGETTVPIINKTAWSDVPVPWPPREERERVVAAVQQLARTAELAQQRRAALDQARRAVFLALMTSSVEPPSQYDRLLSPPATPAEYALA